MRNGEDYQMGFIYQEGHSNQTKLIAEFLSLGIPGRESAFDRNVNLAAPNKFSKPNN